MLAMGCLGHKAVFYGLWNWICGIGNLTFFPSIPVGPARVGPLRLVGGRLPPLGPAGRGQEQREIHQFSC